MTAPATLPDGLARLLRARDPSAQEVERCEMCGEAVPPEHSHLVDLRDRGLKCACRACALLFTGTGTAAGRFRTVPDRVLHDESFTLSAQQWSGFQIPVSVAFFFRNSSLGRVVAFYPSPAGATESLLSLDAWSEVMAGTQLAGELAPDVEALLVSGHTGTHECHLVPIDLCYELVGRVRMRWQGFDGGSEAWADIEDFFARVRARSRPLAGA
jgi:hypothetical protein